MLQAENVDNDVTDCEFSQINSNKPPQGELLPIQIKDVENVVPNNIGHVKNTFDEVCTQFTIALQPSIRVKSKDISNIIPTDKTDKIEPVDIDDNFVATQDINNDLRETFNATLVNAEDELLLCPVGGNGKNEQDIMPKQIIPAPYENKVNVDNDVTDCQFGEINANKTPQGGLIQDEMAKQIVNLDYKKDRQLGEDMLEDNVASEDLPIQIKKVESVVPNNTEYVKKTFDDVVSQFTIPLPSPIEEKTEDIPNIIVTDKADKINPIDVDDHYLVATQDINKDRREKSNVSLVVVSNADAELLLCSVDGNVKNEQDIRPTQIISAPYEKKVNVDNDVTDCQFGEINANKPPQGGLIQDEMAKQVINLDVYKKDRQLDEDMLEDNVASEDLQIQIKKIERVVTNITENVKNTFDDVVIQSTIALPSPIEVKSKDIPDRILNATQDINKDHGEKSNVSLGVASNADDQVVLGPVSGNVKNEQDENKNTYCGIDLPNQENMDYISANYAKSTNVSDSSDEESTPKKSKRFTFTDSDFPDSDEITDILMTYPRPADIESFSESESEDSFDDETDEILRRFRNKTVPEIKIDLSRLIGVEYLPDRVMTRLRNSAPMFKPSYVNEQEDEMDEDIILENIKRLKAFKNAKDSKKHNSIKTEKIETTNNERRKVKVNIGQPVRKGKKTKTKRIARNNTKKDSLELISKSAAKTITRKTRSMKKENDVKNTQNKCIFPGNKDKPPHQPDHKRKPCNKKRICAEIERRRSKRQQKAKNKNDDTMKAPMSILKKSKPKQSTAYNVPSSSSESPKSLKRSLVDDSDVPSSKRTRSHNSNNNKSINNASLQASPARAVRTYVHLSAFPDKEDKQNRLNPYVHLERYEPAEKLIRMLNSNRSFLTRSQLARRRYQRACKRTREAEERRKKEARTSTKRV